MVIPGIPANRDQTTTAQMKQKYGEITLLAKKLRRGLFMGSPVFDGAQEVTIKSMLERSGRSSSGQAILFDGRTGEPLKR